MHHPLGDALATRTMSYHDLADLIVIVHFAFLAFVVIERYLTHVLYANGLTRGMQVALGALVLALNGVLYAVILTRWRRPQLRVPSGR